MPSQDDDEETGSGSDSPPLARRTRSARGALTPAQQRVAAYKQAREARGLFAEPDAFGEGARAAAAAAASKAAAAAAAGTPLSSPLCHRRRRTLTVESLVCAAASERRTRTPGVRVVSRAHAAAEVATSRRLRFEASLPEEDRDAEASREGFRIIGCHVADVRIEVSLRLDDSDAATVLCELRLVPSCGKELPCARACAQDGDADGAESSSLATQLAAALSFCERHKPPHAARDGALVISDADTLTPLSCCSARVRLARLGLRALLPATQKQSYLGFCEPLLAHMSHLQLNTMSTAAVRRWLTGDGACADARALAAALVDAHGVASFCDLQVDHIVSLKWGGVDHPFNFFVLPRALNASFNSDGARGMLPVVLACVVCAAAAPEIGRAGPVKLMPACVCSHGMTHRALRVIACAHWRGRFMCVRSRSDEREGRALHGARRGTCGQSLLRLLPQRRRAHRRL
jgi:hypothetical protein